MIKECKTIDARGLACPKPVILTKKAIDDKKNDRIKVIVDNEPAFINVSRFIEFSNGHIIEKKQENKSYYIVADLDNVTENKIEDVEGISCPVEDVSEHKNYDNIFISSNKLGKGDDELGALLMRGFIYTLTEFENNQLPKKLIMMNSAVKIATNDEDSIENLKKLENSGVELLVCGTCLDFFGLKDQLKVGRISNMYDIASSLIDGKTLTV